MAPALYSLSDTTHTTEIIFGTSTFPAWRTEEGGVLVDFRTYDDRGFNALGFFPERLARLDVPDDIILRAAANDGFLLFDQTGA